MNLFRALENVLAGKTADGDAGPSRRLRLPDASTADTLLAGLEVVTGCLIESGRSGVLSDEELTQLIWKIAAFVVSEGIGGNSYAFRLNMQRIGMYLARNPEVATSRMSLKTVLRYARKEQGQKASCHRANSALEAIEAWHAASPQAVIPLFGMVDDHRIIIREYTFSAIVAGAPLPRLKGKSLLADLLEKKRRIFLAMRGTMPFARLALHRQSLEQLHLHQPEDDAVWQDLALVIRQIEGETGPIKCGCIKPLTAHLEGLAHRYHRP